MDFLFELHSFVNKLEGENLKYPMFWLLGKVINKSVKLRPYTVGDEFFIAVIIILRFVTTLFFETSSMRVLPY